jgi:iron-sulfur cluster repair protein YtfE (RIC family)
VRVATGDASPEERADPTLRLLASLTREGTVVSAFQATHDKFRRFHDDCLRLVARARSDEQALGELLSTLDAYAELFHEHHHAEDNYFFPALRRAEPELGPVVDQLGAQHRHLAAQLTEVMEQAQALRSSATDRLDRLASLDTQIVTLRVSVDEHLVLEETATVPILRTWTHWPV